MSNQSAIDFIDAELEKSKVQQSNHEGKLKQTAEGKIKLYELLRRAIEGKATAEDVGMLDALNDILQKCTHFDSKEPFLQSKETVVKVLVKHFEAAKGAGSE